MLLRLVPEKTTIKFLAMRKVALVASILLIIGSLGLFTAIGLNLGIDFKGGITLEVGTEGKPVPIATVRKAVGSLGLGDVSIKEFGAETEVLIRVERQPGNDAAQSVAMTKVREALAVAIPDWIFRQSNIIGPVVSGELASDGILALSVAMIAVMIYIWFRFEWQ
ncbi:MAG: protein translocase subunit SecF, partial [Kordiimonadaceae bacterium]|nr:protein translocase subunit SecF [Kordiimonadaceae bacterium]